MTDFDINPATRADALQKLWIDTREPPADKVAKLNKEWTDKNGNRQRMSLDYMGHADVTDELLKHDPLWSWEPLALDERGLPAVDRDKEGWPRGLWIRLTVCGHTRLGYGTVEARKNDAIKELIGDALRNAAMRFGVALKLWSKAEWAELELEGTTTTPESVAQAAPAAPRTPAPAEAGTTTPATAPVGEGAAELYRQRVSNLAGPTAKAWNEYRKTNRYPPDLVGLTPGQYEAVDAMLTGLGV